jgi:hypothetical protein
MFLEIAFIFLYALADLHHSATDRDTAYNVRGGCEGQVAAALACTDFFLADSNNIPGK